MTDILAAAAAVILVWRPPTGRHATGKPRHRHGGPHGARAYATADTIAEGHTPPPASMDPATADA